MSLYRSWLNHFFLNLGACLSCLFYAILPPWWTGHTKEDIESLAGSNPWQAFITGIKG